MDHHRNYHEGDRVEVFIGPHDEWVRGMVAEHRERADGRTEYLVQLAGYPALQASDPSNWHPVEHLRPR